MSQLAIVLAFPAISAVIFTVLYGLHRLSGLRQNFEALSLYLYPVALVVPVSVVIFSGFGRSTLSEATRHFSTLLPAMAALPLALLVGIVLYAFDYSIAAWSLRRHPKSRLMEGRSKILGNHQYSVLALSIVTPAVVVAEELIWRLFLMGALWQLGLTTWVVVLISSVAYGMNHYFFGLRNMIVKSVHGASWALLLTSLGSLTWPVASHLAFDGIVTAKLFRANSATVRSVK